MSQEVSQPLSLIFQKKYSVIPIQVRESFLESVLVKKLSVRKVLLYCTFNNKTCRHQWNAELNSPLQKRFLRFLGQKAASARRKIGKNQRIIAKVSGN